MKKNEMKNEFVYRVFDASNYAYSYSYEGKKITGRLMRVELCGEKVVSMTLVGLVFDEEVKHAQKFCPQLLFS